MNRSLLIAALLALGVLPANATELYFGADLSYAGQMMDCNAVYRDNGKTADIFTIFKAHGANLVRVRLWADGNKSGYSLYTRLKLISTGPFSVTASRPRRPAIR